MKLEAYCKELSSSKVLALQYQNAEAKDWRFRTQCYCSFNINFTGDLTEQKLLPALSQSGQLNYFAHICDVASGVILKTMEREVRILSVCFFF